ncbi:MAG: hypothetical protein IKC64_02780, partial [Clostridia bacterium]|nr:hypothetical protein [Clostridia bacterium]
MTNRYKSFIIYKVGLCARAFNHTIFINYHNWRTVMKKITIDGNTAASHVAYAFSEVAAIYPITP